MFILKGTFSSKVGMSLASNHPMFHTSATLIELTLIKMHIKPSAATISMLV